LILIIIGLFLLRYYKNQLNDILNKIDFHKQRILNNLEKNVLEIKNEYNKFHREDTYLIYNVRTNFFNNCRAFINNIEDLEKYKEDLTEEIIK